MRAVLVLIGVSAVIVGCGGGGPPARRDRAAKAQASGSILSAACVKAPGFGGLGASVNAFDANNNNSTGESEPTPGAAWYEIIGTEHGCITAYSVQDSAGPPLRAPQMLELVSDSYLPPDAKQLVRTGSCAIWRSAALRHAVGMRYAQATAVPQTRRTPGRAQIRTSTKPACYVGSR